MFQIIEDNENSLVPVVEALSDGEKVGKALDALFNGVDIKHLSVRERIEVIESLLLKYEQLDIPVKHSFVNGFYIREILIPKGTLLTSKYHKYEQADFMIIGDMSIVTDGGVLRIKAPFSGISYPGLKRLGYAHEDTLWIDVHVTKKTTNIDELEKILYADTFEELEQFETEKQRNDYQKMLLEYNISHEDIRMQSENLNDQIEIDITQHKIKIADSRLSGKGIFATGYIKAKEVIAPARIGGLRTQVGRFTNHSSTPNAEMIFQDDGNIYLSAKRNISCGEITVDYRQSLALIGR